MDDAQPGAGQHGKDCFRNHGHIDYHPVSLLGAPCTENTGESCDLVKEFPVGEALYLSRDRAVINQRNLISPAVFYMKINSIVASVHLPAGKPAVKRFICVIENLCVLFVPIYRIGGCAPELLRVLN